MVGLRDLLRQREEAVIERWLEDTLASYPKDAAVFFGKQKDQFSNPVGDAARRATRAIVEGLSTGEKVHPYRAQLEDFLKIRSIQEFSPSQAVAFVLRLKRVIRAELKGAIKDPKQMAELREIEDEVDGIALLAFDIYMACRQRLFEVRVNELKRSVFALRRHWGEPSDPGPSTEDTSNRGGMQ